MSNSTIDIKDVVKTDEHIKHVHHDEFGAKIGMWLFLFTEMLLFGGLFILYMAYRQKYSGEFHDAAQELNLGIGTINTIILLTSSLTMALSIATLKRGRKWLSVILISTTILFALLFLFNKLSLEWSAEFAKGNYPGSADLAAKGYGMTIFFGLYYAMTGLHGIHVLAGVFLLSVMAVLVIRNKITAEKNILLENSGLYWHLVDLIWIFLFPLFYLLR